MFYIPWAVLPVAVKIFLLGMYALAFIAVVRFARLALRLYRYTGDAVSPENIVKGTVDPSVLATFALASRSLCKSVLPKCLSREGFADAAAEDKAPLIFRMADSRFLY